MIAKERKPLKYKIEIIGVISILIGIITYYITSNWIKSVVSIIVVLCLIIFGIIARKKLKESNKLRKMETVFPEFLELVSSNLRAGMTIDRALLLSSREEFSPLDEEIVRLGKDLVTGKEVESAFKDMAQRINSDKIRKTLNIIITGIRSGGNLATILQETSANMRERAFMEKRAASNVLMYVIFILAAIAIGAPILFGLSVVLVETLSGILGNLPELGADQTQQLPFTLTKVTVSTEFITYYAVLFLIVTNILGALVIGMVSKGEEKAGLRYVIPLVGISLTIFLLVRFALASYFKGFFG